LHRVSYHDGAPQTSPLCAAWVALARQGWTAVPVLQVRSETWYRRREPEAPMTPSC